MLHTGKFLISDINFSQLYYLRNKLWTEIFNLISALVECSDKSEIDISARSLETISVFSETLLELGNEPFIETLCESISTLGSNGKTFKTYKFGKWLPQVWRFNVF